jgi:DnaJ-class molecular chaperone
MKIPIQIGKTISKNEIVICPDCEGEGIIFEWPEREDQNPYTICQTCKGKRVLVRKSDVTYIRLYLKKQLKPENR